MLKPITRKMTDESKDGVYAYTFYCDICGKPWRSEPYYTASPDEIDPLVRESERVAAYERANREALNWLSRCPVCKQVVCDQCFDILDDNDMCAQCAAKEQSRSDDKGSDSEGRGC